MQPYASRYRGRATQPYDPHFVHQSIWRDFDKGVAQSLRRQRRARLLTLLRLRRKPGAVAPFSRTTPWPGHVPQPRPERALSPSR